MAYTDVETWLKDIGDAIRTKTETTELINSQDIPQKISNIGGGSYATEKPFLTLKSWLDAIGNALRIHYPSYNKISTQGIPQLILNINQDRPIVPQEGTWQLKETTDKKYVILGTDDDIQGNARYFRMLRSFDFPYTMNTEAELLNRQLNSDIDDAFTDSDAPSVFPNGTTVKELGKYLVENNLGEVAQHGSSEYSLWSSDKLVGDVLTNLYSDYVSKGGTKTQEQFVVAVKENGRKNDVAQGAIYVEECRKQIEDSINSFVYTVGIWGGEPKVIVDDITINLKDCRTGDYPFREKNYFGAGTSLSAYKDNTSPYDITRDSSNFGHLSYLKDKVGVGHVIELFIHNTTALDMEQLRADLSELKEMVDNGEVEVVTRKQYAELGEYVDNPIVKIDVTRQSTTINLNDKDDKTMYNVIATFANGTTADVTNEAIVKIIEDTSEEKIVKVPAYYKGFTALIDIEISGGGSLFIEPYYVENAKINRKHEPWTIDIVYGRQVPRYDVTGLSSVGVNSTKNQMYLMAFSEEPINDNSGKQLSNYTTIYYTPKNNPTIVNIPENMNYLYIYVENEYNDYRYYPYTVQKI